MFIKRIELSTVDALIKDLESLPADTLLYCNGNSGYLHVAADKTANFDDDALTEQYE